MKALLYKEFRSRSIPERALNGAKTERSIFLQVATIVVALVLTSVATPIVESADKLTYISAWVLQEVKGSNVRVYNAAAFSKDDNECSDAAFRMRLVEASVCITLASSVICTIFLILEYIDKPALRSAAVVSFIITFILILISLGMMMMVMYGKICKKGSLAFSPTGKGYSFGPAVYCLGICILVMVLAYLLLAMRRLHDRKRIREAEEYEEERRRLKEEAEFDAIAEAEAADAAAQLPLSPEDDDENYTWQDVEELVEVTDDEEPTASDWNALSVNSGALPTTPQEGSGSRPTSTADKYKAPPLGPDGLPQKRTKMVMQTVRKRVRRPKPKAPRDPNAPRPPRQSNRRSSIAPVEPTPSGPVFMARPQTGEATAQSPANGRLGIAGAHVAADLMHDRNHEEVVIDVDDDEYSVEEQEPTGDIPQASPQQSKYLEGPYEDHDAPAKPMSPAQGGMAATPYAGTENPQAGFVSLDVDIIDDDFGFSPSKNRKKKKEDRDLDASGWGDLDTLPDSSAANSKPVLGRGRNDPTQADLDADPFPAGPSRAEKKEKKRKKRMAYNANDVYVYTSGGAVGDDNEFDFQDDFAGV